MFNFRKLLPALPGAVCVIMSAILMVGSSLSAAVLRIDPAGDNTDGHTWPTAYRTISDALANSAGGDSMWIKKGIYNETIVLATSVALYGGFAGTETDDEFGARDSVRNRTTLDATGLDGHVVSIIGEATLDGLTITGGRSTYGGGLYCQSSKVLVRDCTITQNRASSVRILPGTYTAAGAGIYCSSTTLEMINVTVAANVLEGIELNNSLISGAGIYGVSSHLKLSHCRIVYNRSQHAEFHAGCGIAVECSVLNIISTEIVGNDNSYNTIYQDPFGFQETGLGSALLARHSSVLLEAIIVSDNIERSPLGGPKVDVAYGDILVDRCVFLHDWVTLLEFHEGPTLNISLSTGSISGSVFYGRRSPRIGLLDSSVKVSYSTFVGNHITSMSTSVSILPAQLHLDNCIIWGYDLRELYRDSGSSIVTVINTDIQIPTPGQGNISADPLFVNPAEGDFRLQPGSPCIDTASASGPAVDIAGRPRPVDVIGTGRDGPGAFDMGAYEFQLAPADFNKDGSVNAKDLLIFQEYWNETQYN